MDENQKKLILWLMDTGLNLKNPWNLNYLFTPGDSCRIKKEKLATILGVSVNEAENIMKKLPLTNFDSPDVRELAFYLEQYIEECASNFVKKFKNKKPINKKELDYLVEIVCKDKNIIYSSDLTERVIKILDEYAQKEL